jgi:hypothetical protein
VLPKVEHLLVLWLVKCANFLVELQCEWDYRLIHGVGAIKCNIEHVSRWRDIAEMSKTTTSRSHIEHVEDQRCTRSYGWHRLN